MKKNIVVAITLILINIEFGFAGDILILNNGKKFDGEIIRIKSCNVIFKANNERYEIPASDILLVKFENPKSKIFLDYIELDDDEKCLRGIQDANKYHKQAAPHIVLGVLFGPFAVIAAILGKPNPKADIMIELFEDKEILDDPSYLKCYRKRSKALNIGNAAFGWFAVVVTFLIVTTSGA